MSTVDYDESMKIDSDIGRLKMTKTNKNDKKRIRHQTNMATTSNANTRLVNRTMFQKNNIRKDTENGCKRRNDTENGKALETT